jgi:hypothetical protein
MFTAKIVIGGNPDHFEPPLILFKRYIKAESYDALIKLIDKLKDKYGFGGGNWYECKLHYKRKFIGYMSYNCRVWDSKNRSLDGKEVTLEEINRFLPKKEGV